MIGNKKFISKLEIEYCKKYESPSDYVFGPSFNDSIHRALNIPFNKRLGEIIRRITYTPTQNGYILEFKEK